MGLLKGIWCVGLTAGDWMAEWHTLKSKIKTCTEIDRGILKRTLSIGMESFVSTSSVASCAAFDCSHPNSVEAKKKKNTVGQPRNKTKNVRMLQHLSFNSAVGEHWILCETRTPVIAASNSLYPFKRRYRAGLSIHEPLINPHSPPGAALAVARLTLK